MEITPSLLYKRLLPHFGHQDWWPVDSLYHKKHDTDPRFEIMIGAILTQNTAWSNVEKALTNLKNEKCLTVNAIFETDIEQLKTLIQPSGFFNQKAQRLKALASHLHDHYNSDLSKFFSKDMHDIRQELLSLNGIGPETADSMLSYAGRLPVFVVDAYTKRICKRLPVKIKNDTYDVIQQYFEKDIHSNFSKDDLAFIFQEFHALIVELAKTYCKAKPECDNCPLNESCEHKTSLSQ